MSITLINYIRSTSQKSKMQMTNIFIHFDKTLILWQSKGSFYQHGETCSTLHNQWANAKSPMLSFSLFSFSSKKCALLRVCTVTDWSNTLLFYLTVPESR